VKVTNSIEYIGAFGGLNFISEKFNTIILNSLIYSYLRFRLAQSAYNYAAVIKNLWLLFLSGDGCAEDIEEHLRS
jgi:hypothetical protein